MAATYDLFGSIRFQAAWKKFDLLVQIGDKSTLIEFKYYLLRQTLTSRGGRSATRAARARPAVELVEVAVEQLVHCGDTSTVAIP